MMKFVWRWSIKQILLTAIVIAAPAVVLTLGVLIGLWRTSEMKTYQREELLHQAQDIAQVIGPDLARSMTFSAADRETEAFERVGKLLDVYGSQIQLHNIFTFGRRGETLVYGPSRSFGAPVITVGEEYSPTTDRYISLFENGSPFLVGPDDGILSAVVPVIDGPTHEVVMGVVLEKTAAVWQAETNGLWYAPVLGCVLIVLLLLAGTGLILLRNHVVTRNSTRDYRHLDTVLCVIFCLTVIGVIAYFMYDSEALIRRRHFRDIVDRKTENAFTLTHQIENRLKILADRAAADDALSQESFANMAAPLLFHRAVQSCYYIPVVPHEERTRFEESAAGLGIEQYQIQHLDEQGHFTDAGEADRYYPVLFSASATAPDLAPGFDLGVLPEQQAAITRAMTTGLSTVSGDHVPHVLGREREGRLLVYVPVQTVTNDETSVRGLAALDIDLPRLLTHAVIGGEAEAPAVSMMMLQLGSGAPLEVLAMSRADVFARRLTPSPTPTDNTLYAQRPLYVFSNTYALAFHPEPVFFRRYPLSATRNTVIIGLWLTIALTLLVGFLRNQHARLEVSIWQRTVELTEREEAFRRLFADSMDPILLLRKGCFVDCNKAALRVLQCDAKQMLVNRRPEEISPQLQPDGRRSETILQEMTALCIKHGHHMFEFNHLRRDGSILPVEIMMTLISIRGMNHIHVTWRDITERKRAEEALRASEEKYRGLVDSLPIGLYRNTPGAEGRFIMVNNALAKIHGFESPADLMGCNVQELYVNPEDRDALSEALLAEGQVQGREVQLKRKDGTPIWASITARAVHGPDGEVECFDGSIMDITERKEAAEHRMEMERRLLHTQKLESLGILAGGIAHDFNNLLMVILGNLEVMMETMDMQPQASGYIDKIIIAARRAAMLTNQMLAYSGKGQFLIDSLNVTELVKENVQIFRSTVDKRIAIQMRLCNALPLIMADEGQIQQVVMNLITNAAEAIGENTGAMTIVTGRMHCTETYLQQSHIFDKPAPGSFVWIEVSDTGCGMDAAMIDRIFDPFFTTKFTGRGLGMSAVLGIIKGHEGALIIDSVPGVGTSIRILFPAASPVEIGNEPEIEPPMVDIGQYIDKIAPPEEEETHDEQAPPQKDQPPCVAGTILVVDDEEPLRDLGQKVLGQLGYKTMTAEDGQEALEIFEAHADEIVAVLLDLTMPRLDGVSAFNAMRAIKPDIKVILCSGFSEQEAIENFAEGGPDGFIHKPYRVAALRKEMSRILGNDRP